MGVSTAHSGYPLISWVENTESDIAGAGAYEETGRIMAIAMLVCIPLSIGVSIMSGRMLKQIRKAANN